MFTESHSRDAICRRGACMCSLLLPPSPFVRARELLLNLESEERWDGAWWIWVREGKWSLFPLWRGALFKWRPQNFWIPPHPQPCQLSLFQIISPVFDDPICCELRISILPSPPADQIKSETFFQHPSTSLAHQVQADCEPGSTFFSP